MIAELVAAGCGDWDRLDETWDLHRYAAMQRHWRSVAPPLNVTLAAFCGFKPRAAVQPAADAFDIDAFLQVAAMFQG